MFVKEEVLHGTPKNRATTWAWEHVENSLVRT